MMGNIFKSRRDVRLAAIAFLVLVTLIVVAFTSGAVVAAAVAASVALTNLLGGSWSGLHWSRWVLIILLALAITAVALYIESQRGGEAMAAVAVIAAVSNLLVIFVRLFMQDKPAHHIAQSGGLPVADNLEYRNDSGSDQT